MRQGEEFDRALVNVELLEVAHARAIARTHPPVASSSTASITTTASSFDHPRIFVFFRCM
jgi:hypothetical protein